MSIFLDQRLQMTHNIKERILDANSTLTITCTYAFEDEYQKENFAISWEIPDYLFQNAEVDNTLYLTVCCLTYFFLILCNSKWSSTVA